MKRTQKEDKVAALHESFQSAVMVVVTHLTGMTVAETTDLRRRMRAAGSSFHVTKNRLARIALQGTRYEKLDGLFAGPTAVAFSQDPVASAKAMTEYAKKSAKVSILGGGLGDQQIDLKGVEALATMPPIEELRAKLVGLLQTPAGRMVGVLQAPATQVVGVLAAPGGQLARVVQARAQQLQQPA